ERDGFIAVQDRFRRLVGFALDHVAAKAPQEWAEGIRIPFGLIRHAQIERIIELAALLKRYEGRIELVERPGLVERGNTDAVLIEHRAAGIDRERRVPKADRIDRPVVFADGAGQEPLERAFGKLERLHVTGPRPV